MTVLNREKALNRVQGSEELLLKLFQLFLEFAPHALEELRKAVTTWTCQGIRARAHSMKSPCASIGAETCFHLARQIEHLACKGDLDPIPSLVNELEEEMPRLLAALEREIDTSVTA